MEPEINDQDKEMVDFRKINTFGETGVGKSSFISWLENYENDNFQIVDNDEKNSLKSFDDSRKLVEQVKRVKVPINKNKDIHFLLYEKKS